MRPFKAETTGGDVAVISAPWLAHHILATPDDKLSLTIHSAKWGTAKDSRSVLDPIVKHLRNAVMLRVNNDAFPGPDPAWGDDSKYVEVTYSHSGSGGKQTVMREQGQWLLLPEDPMAKAEIASLEQRLTRMKAGLQDLQKAGELQLIAQESRYLKSILLNIEQDAKVVHDEAALETIKRPLSIAALSTDDTWKWYHKSLSHFQRAYEIHRIHVLNASVQSDVVANAVVHVSTIDFQQAIEMLERNTNQLLTRQNEIIIKYNNM